MHSPPLVVATVSLLALTLGGSVVLVPLHANLICTSFLVVYLGAHRSLAGAGEDGERRKMETMERKDALWFPVLAGCTLCGLFVLFKFLDKDMVNLLITVYISIISVFICANEARPVVKFLYESQHPLVDMSLHVPFSFRLFGDGSAPAPASEPTSIPSHDEVRVTPDNKVVIRLRAAWILSLVVGVAVTVWYVKTRSWVANNLIGIAMSLQAMESLSLGSYKTGCVLLCLLFFYDIFFVFGTDVMVTVAKSVDAPIKLLFVKSFAAADADAQFSMLGLGDIVLPGVFVALMLRYDAKNANLELGMQDHSSSDFPKPVFNLTALFYALGLWCTVLVMHVFKHPQPALLYLVPAVLSASILAGFLNGSMRDLWSFDETPQDESVAATDANKKQD